MKEITLQQYVKENNLPDFVETWEEVENLTGKTITQIQQEFNQEEIILLGSRAHKIKKQATLETIIAEAIAPYMKPTPATIDENKVIELIKKFAPVKEIQIKTNDKTNTVPGAQHEKFETVLKMIGAGLNLYLYGPAGTGKTQLAETAAQALNKRFCCISVCSQSTKSDLLGFIGATGNYVKSLFREAYENGGVFLIDEIDNGNPNVLAVLNSALANGYCAFPDGMIKRSPDFICIAAANTFGTGANREYVGRNQLDAATLNRFVQIEVNYDENLETQIFGDIAKDVQTIRRKLKGERVIVSMRNILNASKLESAGYSRKEAIQLAVINTIPENLKSKI